MRTARPQPLLTLLSLSLFSWAPWSPGAQAPAPRFEAVEIDAKLEIGYGVTVADVNGDRKPDILLVDKQLVVWYENPSWAKHIMTEKLTSLDHVCIAARDLDGDGKCEVAGG